MIGASMRGNSNTLVGYRALTETLPVARTSKQLRDADTRAAQSIIVRYLQMDKTLVESSDAAKLVDMADKLEEKDAHSSNTMLIRGWMLAEASLAGGEDFSWSERTELLDRSEVAFDAAIVPTNKDKLLTDHRYRIALAIAHVPLIRAIVDGDVTENVQASVTQDVLEIANTVNADEHLPGLAHELSMMGLMHMMQDPRYVVIPSTYRGGNGTHHKSQTHDLSLIKQHYGQIRQVQPIEVKSSVVDRHRERYWSTLLSSATIISSLGDDPDAFNRSMLEVFNGNASDMQFEAVQVAMNGVVQSLKAYRTTGKPKEDLAPTLTQFYGRNQFIAA